MSDVQREREDERCTEKEREDESNFTHHRLHYSFIFVANKEFGGSIGSQKQEPLFNLSQQSKLTSFLVP